MLYYIDHIKGPKQVFLKTNIENEIHPAEDITNKRTSLCAKTGGSGSFNWHRGGMTFSNHMTDFLFFQSPNKIDLFLTDAYFKAVGFINNNLLTVSKYAPVRDI